MSRHRSAVETTLERIRRCAVERIDAAFAREMRRRGEPTIILDVLGESPLNSSFAVLRGELHRLLTEAHRLLTEAQLETLHEAQIVITARFDQRQSACVVSGRSVVRSQMHGAHVIVCARIKTRWLHIWRESGRDFQWPAESR